MGKAKENHVVSHDVNQCLSCMDLSGITASVVKRKLSMEPTDKQDAIVRKVSDSTSGNMLERLMKGKRGDVISAKEIGFVKREILRLIVNLSSAVTSKSHQQSLRG